MSVWFEIAVVATIFAIGNILFGHFEEGTPRWRRLLKMLLIMGLALFISTYLGTLWFWVFLVAMMLPSVYIHAYWLPKNGVNGWTGEPRDVYYKLRGWALPHETHAESDND